MDLMNREPLYLQIRNYLFEIVVKNSDQKAVCKLPSESMIMRKFGVSRATAIAALRQLENEGYIFRVQGKGTFVNNKNSQKMLEAERNRKTAGDHHTVGCIISDLYSNFTASIVESASRYFSDRGYQTLISLSDFSIHTEQAYLKYFEEQGVSGVLLLLADQQKYNIQLMQMLQKQYPVVFLDRTLPNLNVTTVSSNHRKDAETLTKALIRKGHRKIGIVSLFRSSTSSIEERMLGYEDALKSCGMPVEHRLKLDTLINYDEEGIEKIEEFLLTNHQMTALISINSNLTLQIMKTLRRLGDRAPDLELASFDNNYFGVSEFFSKPYIYIKQDTAEIGRTAAHCLIRRIEGKEVSSKHFYIDSELVGG